MDNSFSSRSRSVRPGFEIANVINRDAHYDLALLENGDVYAVPKYEKSIAVDLLKPYKVTSKLIC